MNAHGRFGPFHRRSFAHPEEVDAICVANMGAAPAELFAGLIPAVKAWEGPLPEGVVGVEFYKDVAPDPSSVPGWPEWTQGRPGVIVLERDELVAIPVVVTIRHDAE